MPSSPSSFAFVCIVTLSGSDQEFSESCGLWWHDDKKKQKKTDHLFPVSLQALPQDKIITGVDYSQKDSIKDLKDCTVTPNVVCSLNVCEASG